MNFDNETIKKNRIDLLNSYNDTLIAMKSDTMVYKTAKAIYEEIHKLDSEVYAYNRCDNFISSYLDTMDNLQAYMCLNYIHCKQDLYQDSIIPNSELWYEINVLRLFEKFTCTLDDESSVVNVNKHTSIMKLIEASIDSVYHDLAQFFIFKED